MKKLFYVLLISSIVSLVTTSIFAVLAISEAMNMDTDISDNLALDKAEAMMEIYKRNDNMVGYMEAKEEIKKIEDKREREEFMYTLKFVGMYVGGAVTAALIAATAVTGVKCKKGLQSETSDSI